MKKLQSEYQPLFPLDSVLGPRTPSGTCRLDVQILRSPAWTTCF